MRGLLKKNMFLVLLLLFSCPGLAQVDVQKQKELFDFTTNGALVNLTPKVLSRISQMKFSFGYNKTSFGHISKGFS